MGFQEKLDKIIEENNSLVCVGLDTDTRKLPKHLLEEKEPKFTFNKAIIDATHDLVCAYKPNSAFYEASGAQGIHELFLTCQYLKETYPNIPILLDAKRADIGTTNLGYIEFAYDYLGVDAITLQPFLGKEALQPFLVLKEKGSFILCRTSNPGAGELQDLLIDGVPLYKIIAKKVATEWNSNNNCMVVAGATFPGELAEVRKIVGDITILSPGVGAQAGDLTNSVKAGLNAQKKGLIINSSRGIIYASPEKDFADAARNETIKLQKAINAARSL